jgi:hypothetical protein
MKLLVQPYRALTRIATRDPWFSCGVLAILAGIELLGRHCQADWQDALLGIVLALLVAAITRRHMQRPLAWVDRLNLLGRGMQFLWRRYSCTVGIDLRGRPPLSYRVPGPLLVAVAALAIWTILMAVAARHFPSDARAIAVQVCYLVYLVSLMVLWAACLVGILVGIIPALMIHDWFAGTFTGPGRRPLWPELCTIAGYFIALTVAAVCLPLWVPFVFSVAPLILLMLAGLARSLGDAQMVWRYKGRGSISVMPLHSWLTLQAAIFTLLAVDLGMTTCGASLVGFDTGITTMPITMLLGKAVAWMTPGFLWCIIGHLAWAKACDPARPYRPVLHLQGDLDPVNRRSILQFFHVRGWKIRTSHASPRPLDVCVQLVRDPTPIAEDADVTWPMQVRALDLLDPDVYWRLERRLSVLQRRQLLAGIRKLFKVAARRKYANGTGYWVAPHLWPILGLCRDTDDDDFNDRDSTILSHTIGPHYRRVLAHAARHHAYQILSGVEVDMILVEDGVGFQRFRRVLRMLFEVYDIHGGRRRAEELHFVGVRGIRVIIHEFRLDNPFQSDVYPEPDYEDLGRARILHIFRDRDEHEEPADVPADDANQPVPASEAPAIYCSRVSDVPDSSLALAHQLMTPRPTSLGASAFALRQSWLKLCFDYKISSDVAWLWSHLDDSPSYKALVSGLLQGRPPPQVDRQPLWWM